jgi:hypothetical protein
MRCPEHGTAAGMAEGKLIQFWPRLEADQEQFGKPLLTGFSKFS